MTPDDFVYLAAPATDAAPKVRGGRTAAVLFGGPIAVFVLGLLLVTAALKHDSGGDVGYDPLYAAMSSLLAIIPAARFMAWTREDARGPANTARWISGMVVLSVVAAAAALVAGIALDFILYGFGG